MANEQEQREGQDRRGESMRRLQGLRDNVRDDLTGIVNRYYDRRMDDASEEKGIRGQVRDELRSVQRRIDETIDSL